MPKTDKFNGINNTSAHEKLKKEDFTRAVNVMVDDQKRVMLRPGKRKVLSGSGYHSVWSGKYTNKSFVAQGDTLFSLNSDYTTSQVGTVSEGTTRICYGEDAGIVYLTDGVANWRIDENGELEPLSPASPLNAPALSSGTTGLLPAGEYRVRYTYVTALGLESAMSPATAITLTEDGSIFVSCSFAQAPAGAGIKVYLTVPGSGEYYRQLELPYGTNAGTIASVLYDSKATTYGLAPLPGGHIIKRDVGRTLVANDNVLYFSEAFWPGLMDAKHGFFQFPERITIVAPVLNGWFVVAERTYFIAGNNPKEMHLRPVAPYRAVESTQILVAGEDIADSGMTGRAWLWLSEEGVCLGGGDGLFKNLTKDRYAMAGKGPGAAATVQHNGASQFVGVAQKKDIPAGTLYTSDEAVGEIIRNGVVIT